MIPIVGAVFFVVGGVLAAMSGMAALEYRDAVELRGVVIAKTRVRADRENRATQFLVHTRVDVPGGAPIEAQERVSRADWERRVVGGEHRLLYLPALRKALPRPWSGEFIGSVIPGVAGAIIALIGALLLRASLRRNSRGTLT